MKYISLLILICLCSVYSQSIICVDAGHGGSDPGAVGCGREEKNINLDVANRFYNLLKNAGYKAYLTRSNDSTVSLASRASYANNIGAHRFISVHCNAFNGSANGTETFCYPNCGDTTYNLRNKTNPLVVQAFNTYNRGCKTAEFYVLKYTNMPAILVELAFIDNASDSAKLGDPYYRQRGAEALLNGLQAAGREDSEEKEIASTKSYIAPRWSPEGNRLLVSTPGYHGLYVISISDRGVQKISDEKYCGYKASWHSLQEIQYQVQNDSFIITTDMAKTKTISKREVACVYASEGIIYREQGTEKQALSDTQDTYFNPVLSPDKTMVVYEGLNTGLHVSFLESKKQIALGKGNNPSWTPDSSKVVFDVSEDNGSEITASDLWIVKVLDPTQRVNLTRHGSFLSQRPSVSPDGTKIAFDAQGKVYIANLGENLIKNCTAVSD